MMNNSLEYIESLRNKIEKNKKSMTKAAAKLEKGILESRKAAADISLYWESKSVQARMGNKTKKEAKQGAKEAERHIRTFDKGRTAIRDMNDAMDKLGEFLSAVEKAENRLK